MFVQLTRPQGEADKSCVSVNKNVNMANKLFAYAQTFLLSHMFGAKYRPL